MASIMSRAAREDDLQAVIEQEALAELQYENQTLRELLQIGHPTYSDGQLEVSWSHTMVLLW